MSNDSIELGRIRAKILRIEEKTDKLTIVDTTASFDQTVSITGNLYVNGEAINISSLDVSSSITSALIPYAISNNVSSSITGALNFYATSINVSASVTSALNPYATSITVSSSVTSALNPYGTSANISSSVTSALNPYATSVNVSSSVTSSINTLKTDLTASYATSIRVSSSVTSALNPYATSTNVSSSVTSSINTLKTDLTASYARIATANIFTANQTITGTLAVSSHITGNGNMYISGNVGIGINTPSTPLHLKSTGPIQFIIEADSDNAIESDNANILLKQDGGAVQAEIGMFDAENILRINNMYGDALWLGTTDTPRLYIDSTGSVGIGTTSPAQKLQVVGNALIGGTTTTTNYSQLSVNGDLALQDGNPTLNFVSGNGTTRFGYLSHEGTNNNMTLLNQQNALLSLGTNNATYLFLSGARVGLGTGTPTVAFQISNANSTYTDPLTNNLPTVIATNTSNASTTAHSILATRVGGSSGGDPFIAFDIAGVTGWSIGVDNSDSDKFKISNNWTDVGISNLLTIQTNGNVGINTTTPSLQGSGTGLSILGSQYIQLQLSGTGAGGIQLNCNGGDQYEIQADNNDAFFVYNRTDAAYRFYIDTTGSVGINTTVPTQMLDVNGTVRVRTRSTTAGSALYFTSDGTLSSVSSDIRIKKNVSTITGSLEKVNKLRGVTFEWDDTRFDNFKVEPEQVGKKFIGFIAQEVESITPELSYTNNDSGLKSVRYSEMTALLVEAIKDLSKENDYLKNKLEEKDKQLDDILLRLAALENK